MEIKNMKNKVKISFEYPKKIIGFGTITRKDLEKLSLRIFLDDKTEIYSRQINQITFCLKEEEDD